MKVVYTLPAFLDLDSIVDHIGRESRQSASRVAARIASAIDGLIDHPYIGRQTEDPAIRMIVARPYPYLIFYEIVGEEIVVVAIRHGARDPSGRPGKV